MEFNIERPAAKSLVRNGLSLLPPRRQPCAELGDREAQVKTAIKLLRETADDYESSAKQIPDRAARAELSDICVEWHLLARAAAMLHDKADELLNA
jgi:hypothetical protein